MRSKTAPILMILVLVGATFGQPRSYESPNKKLRVLIIPLGETYESRVEIRSSSGVLLRRKSFASHDHNHGEGVAHAEWTADGRLFVFNTNSSGGHQPWHWFTYVYSTRTNEFYSLDSTVGAITSDFELRGDTLVTTRLAPEGGKEMPLTIRLARWR